MISICCTDVYDDGAEVVEEKEESGARMGLWPFSNQAAILQSVV